MSARVRRRQRRSGGSPAKKIALGFGVVLAILGLCVASVGFWVLDVRADAPSIDDLKAIDKGEVSTIFAADGSRLGVIQDDSIREKVSIENIPKELKEATIAIEDESFKKHTGVDYQAIVRAAVENIEAGEVKQGGSTITQQLARNLYLSDPEDTIERKIREAKLAEEMEDEHSKKWILEQYLNTASYGTNNGRTAVGVEAASQVYFNKTVNALSLHEAALLAGLPQAPSQYNPFDSAEAARVRRNIVLREMYEQDYISLAEEREALAADLGLQRGYRYETIREPYFFNYVEAELIERYGVETVRQGGLNVYTTISPGLQAVAEQAVANGVTPLGGPAGALVSTDVDTGNIVAMASSGEFADRNFNLAAQGKRQPGSAFKPFALAEAIHEGVDPDTTYYSGQSPITLSMGAYSAPWVVNNSSEASSGTLSLTSATTNSTNAVYAQLALDLGPENVADMAHDLGITSPLNGYPAETIGGLEVGVSPLEMSNAYATFGNGGLHNPATAIAKVSFPNGETDEPDPAGTNRALTDGEAYEVTRVLETVVDSGTATAANYGCSAIAGKTGTTDENTDAWFVGYTPNLSTAVWIGYPDSRTTLGSSAFGGTYSAPIWNEFMSQADPDCAEFEVPDELPSLSSFYGEHTVSEPSSDDDYTTPAPSTSTTSTTESTSEDDGNGSGAYNDDQLQDGANPADD
ncbi:MAG: transglycosylase domain-containing protein [Solirubrobacterales bacterium]